jgi:hypothetical protein
MKLTYSLPALLLFTTLSQAALPPVYERSREIADIVGHSGILNVITDVRYRGKASGMIDSIAYVGNGQNVMYQVTSGSCSLTVTLVSKSETPIVGPWQYNIFWEKEMTCQ